MKIWTNGCFDVLHIGHIELLKFAKSLGQHLIVGIDSDTRIKKIKGKSRPINNQQNRKNFLQSIRYVDEVIIFNDENELNNYVDKLSIDIIVVGDDYIHKKVIGSEHAEVKFFPRISGISSTDILKSIESR